MGGSILEGWNTALGGSATVSGDRKLGWSATASVF
jgi:hypothetical protein